MFSISQKWIVCRLSVHILPSMHLLRPFWWKCSICSLVIPISCNHHYTQSLLHSQSQSSRWKSPTAKEGDTCSSLLSSSSYAKSWSNDITTMMIILVMTIMTICVHSHFCVASGRFACKSRSLSIIIVGDIPVISMVQHQSLLFWMEGDVFVQVVCVWVVL